MIELPKTLRPPGADEVPDNSSAKDRLNKLKTANIVEGYVIHKKESDKENKNIPFGFYAEININNSKLWDLIGLLSNELPDVAALIFGLEETEPNYGEYVDKSDLLTDLTKFKKELTQDTFIEWGLIYNDAERLIEIFISESKYIRFWGVNKKSFLQIMNDFKLKEINNLEFIDEYPNVREPLTSFDSTAIDSSELIKRLKEKYVKK